MLVSICIPTYSRLQYLKQSVQACLDQTYADIEICVSQDPKKEGADPEINQWCMEQNKNIPYFKYNLNEKNIGLAGNWNKCVEMASGSYITIIGDDDLIAPDFVAKMVDQIVTYKADVAFCNQYFIDTNGHILKDYTIKSNEEYKRNNLKTGLLEDPIKVVLNNSVPMSGSIIKRDLLLKHHFDANLNTPEFEVFLKIAVNNGVFVYNPEQLASYRVHSLSATSGGLTIHRLLKNVIDIYVPEKYKELKYEFVSSKIISAVNMSLRSREKKLAKFLLRSSYYPKDKFYLRVIQNSFLYFPNWAIKILL